jgi:hypothetical protein
MPSNKGMQRSALRAAETGRQASNMRPVPDWAIQASWWASGIFATGALWYFLSAARYWSAGLSAVGATTFAVLAVVLHRRKDAFFQRSDNVSPSKDPRHGSVDEPAELPSRVEATFAGVPQQQEVAQPPAPPARFGPLNVTFSNGKSASVEFNVVMHVQARDAPSFIARHGTYESGISTCRSLLESVVRSTLEEQASAQAARSNRRGLDSLLKGRVQSRLAATSITVDAFALGEIRDA